MAAMPPPPQIASQAVTFSETSSPYERDGIFEQPHMISQGSH